MAPTNDPIPCVHCGGRGVIDKDDMTAIMCICTKFRLLRIHLSKDTPDILHAADVKESPLYVLGSEKGKPSRDRTKDNLFLCGLWRNVVSHLKWTLYFKGLTYTYRIVTDERIKNVAVGNESYKGKTEDDRKLTESVNGLRDLVEDPDLVIVRLGFLGYKNIAAPGYLKEALMIRESAGKPTWLVEGAVKYEYDHRAYSPETYSYIHSRFETLALHAPGSVEGASHVDTSASATVTVAEDPDYMNEAARPSVEEEPAIEYEQSYPDPVSNGASDFDNDSVLGGGPKKRRMFRPKHRRSGGGGYGR